MATVAQTILAQLGGKKFIAMTGASAFIGGVTTLKFKIPKAKSGINVVSITLTPADEYTVEFFKMRGLDWTLIHKAEGQHAEDLQPLFTRHTGLDTHL